MANPIITYDAHVISPGIDLTVTHAPDHPEDITASYTDRTSAGGTPPSTDMAYGHVNIKYSNVTWVINSDNSITVTGSIDQASFIREQAYFGPVSYEYEIWFTFNGRETYRTQVVATQSLSRNREQLGIPATFTVTVPPQQTSDAAGIFFHSKSVGYTYAPDEFVTGIRIQNPNLPDYRPGAIRDSNGVWQSHNRSGGEVHIRNSNGVWVEERTMSGGESCGNPPSIRKSDKWFNQRKIGKE